MAKYNVTFTIDTELTSDKLEARLSKLGNITDLNIVNSIFDSEGRVKVSDLWDYVVDLCDEHYNPQVSWEINGEEDNGDEDDFFHALGAYDDNEIVTASVSVY